MFGKPSEPESPMPQLNGREAHELDVLARLQFRRREHEQAERIVARTEAVLLIAKQSAEATAERLADSLKEARRVMGA